MQRWSEAIRTFESGEVGTTMLGRADNEIYDSGASKLLNFIIADDGSLFRRSGTRFVSEVKESSQVSRLVPFTYSTKQAYVLEFGNFYLRFYRNEVQIEATDVAGTPLGVAYEISTPFNETELFDLRFTQSADVLFIVHEKHAPRKLIRRDTEPLANTDSTTWSIESMYIKDGPYLEAQSGGATHAHPGVIDWHAPGLSIMELEWNTGSSPHIVAGDTRLIIGTMIDDDADTGLFLADGTPAFSAYPKGDGQSWRTAGFEGYGGAQLAAPASWWERLYGGTTPDFYFDSTSKLQGVNPSGEGRPVDIDSAYEEFDVRGVGFLERDIGRSFRFAGSISPSYTVPTNKTFNTGHEWLWGVITDVHGAIGDHKNVIADVDIKGPLGNQDIIGTLLGSPTSTTQDPSAFHTWEGFRMGAWYVDNFPRVITIYEQRLVMCGEPNTPNLLHASVSAQFDVFAPTGDVSLSPMRYPTSGVYPSGAIAEALSDLILDDNGFSFEIATDEVGILRWAVGTQNALVLGTAASVVIVRGGSSREALSPRNIFAQETSLPGSADIAAFNAENSVFYVGRDGRELFRVMFSIDVDAFRARDTTEHAQHILDTGVVELDYAAESDRLLLAVTGEGRLATMALSPDGRL